MEHGWFLGSPYWSQVRPGGVDVCGTVVPAARLLNHMLQNDRVPPTAICRRTETRIWLIVMQLYQNAAFEIMLMPLDHLYKLPSGNVPAILSVTTATP